MKIALITSKYPRLSGTFIQREINGLKKAGAIITVYPLYDLEKSLFNNENVLSTFENEIREWPKISDCKFLSINYLKGFFSFITHLIKDKEIIKMVMIYKNDGLMDMLKFLYCLPKTFFWLKNMDDYDHILSFWGNYSASAGYIISKKSGIPFSTYLHAGTDLYRKQTYLYQKLTHAKVIICVCEFNRQFLKKKYKEMFKDFKSKIIIHHLGLDLSFIKLKSIENYNEDEQFKICSIGSLIEAKGVLLTLKSFKKFLDMGNKGHLTFCGSGNLESTMMSYALENNIIPFITFRGECSNFEVNETLVNSDVLVHNSPFIGDAVPTVIKEAMAMSRAVVATNIAGIPELVEHEKSGIIVPPNDVDFLAITLDELNKNRRKCYDMGQVGNIIAQEKFNLWQNTKLLFKYLKNELV